jgi:rhodanese-related sulfurtransferase
MIAFTRALGTVCLALLPFFVLAQDYAYETKDWGVKPTSTIKRKDFHAPTPMEVPGAKTVRTVELKEMMSRQPAPVLVDVLGGKTTIKGAVGMRGAGEGLLLGPENERFAKAMETLTRGDKNAPVVFFCLSSECWLSYNASLAAIELGYKGVIWYRGGTDAWKGASGEFAPLTNAAGW